MPRTREQIQAEMDATQSTMPELAALNSTSQVSIFSLLKNLWISFIQTIEQQVQDAKDELAATLAAQQIGSIAWYVSTIKKFQIGDAVSVYDGVRVGYPLTDLNKRIISQVSVSEDQTSGRLLIKLAKYTGELSYVPLTADELTAAKEYIRQIKYAGVGADIVSLAADELKVVATVQYDRQVINATGQRLTNLQSLPILEALIIYTQNMSFDSVVTYTALTDAVQANAAYNGAIDFKITQAYTRPAGSTEWVPFDRSVTSRAGYMLLDIHESQFSYV